MNNKPHNQYKQNQDAATRLQKALTEARERADEDLLRSIGVSMASFIAEIDSDSNNVALYISQRLAPLIPLTHIDIRVKDAVNQIAQDGRKLKR